MTNDTDASIWLYGVPSAAGTDTETSKSADSHIAPDVIRKAYSKLFSGYNIPCHFEDKGDVELSENPTVDELLNAVYGAAKEALQNKKKLAILGGSHTLTLGTLRAVKEEIGEFSLLYYDAHPDLMPDPKIYYGSTIHHAIEEKVLNPSRIAFTGIRQIEEEERECIAKHSMKVLSPVAVSTKGIEACLKELEAEIPPPYFISIDLDGLEPGIAPGVTTPFPFGISPRELLGLSAPFCEKACIGFEIVEHSPSRDFEGTTAFLAAALLQELSAATSKSSIFS